MIRKIAGCLCLILIVSTFTGCFKLDPDKEFDKMYDVVSGSGSFSEAKKAYEDFQTKLNKEYEKLGQKEHEKGMSEDDLALFKDIQRVLSNGGDLYPEFMAKGEALGSLEEKREASVWIQNHTYWGGPELAVILDGRTYYEMRYSGEDEVVDLSRVERRLGEDGLEFNGFEKSDADISSYPITDPFGEEVEISAVMPVVFHYQGYQGKGDEVVRVEYGDEVELPVLENEDDSYFAFWATERGDYVSGDYYISQISMSAESIITESHVDTADLESPDIYAIYSRLESCDPVIFDGGYTNAGNVNPGEKVKIIPVIENTGTRSEIFSIELRELDKESAQYASAEVVGTFARYNPNSYTDDFPLYPGMRIAVSSYTDDSYGEGSFDLNENHSDAYVELEIDKATPPGTVISVPMRLVNLDGYVFDVEYKVTVEESDFNPVLRKYKFIEESGNGDGVINPGETIYLDILLEGKGVRDTGRGLRSILSTESDDVEFISSMIRDDYLRPGEFATGTYCNYSSYERAERGLNPGRGENMFKFEISPSCQGGTVIPFTITTTDNTGVVKKNTFELTVNETDADIAFGKYGLKEIDGDGDGRINPGETFALDVNFQNKGSSTLRNLFISLSPEDENVTLSTPGDIWEIGKDGREASNTWKEIESGRYVNSRYYNDGNKTYPDINDSLRVKLSKDYDYSKPLVFNWMAYGDGNIEGWSGSFALPVSKADGNLSLSGYQFIDNGNGDGVINIGESGYLDVRIFNSGSSKVKAISATLEKVEGDAIVTKGTYTFGDLSSKRYKSIRSGNNSYTERDSARLSQRGNISANAFQIRLPNDAKEGGYSVFRLTLEDAYGNKWERELKFLQEKALLGVNATISYYDKPSFEYVYPGEDLMLKVALENTSSGNLSGVKCVFSSDSKYVSIKEPSWNYGDISRGRSKELRNRSDNPFRISSSAPVGEVVAIKATFTDNSGVERSFEKSFTVGVERFDPIVARSNISGIAPDGSSKVRKGGYVFLDAVVQNLGPVAGEDVSAVFSTESGYLTINTPEIKLGVIASGCFKSIGYPEGTTNGYSDLKKASANLKAGYGAEIRISDDAPRGGRIPVKMTISEMGVPLYEYEFSVVVM